MDQNSNGPKKNRRQVLRTFAASSGVAGTMITSAQGVDARGPSENGKLATEHEKAKRLREKYSTPEKVRELFLSEVDGLVTEFYEIGILGLV